MTQLSFIPGNKVPYPWSIGDKAPISLVGVHLEGGVGVFLHSGADAEGRFKGVGRAVVHDRKLAIRRHQLQRALCLKPVQRHALMEVAVVQHHGVAAVPVPPIIRRARCLPPPDHQAVIQRDRYCWVAGQIALHLRAMPDMLGL